LISTTSCYLVIEQVFLKVQCKLNGSGLQYVRVRAYSSKKSCTMTSPHGCSESFGGDTGYRVYSTQSPLSSTDLLLIAQELRYIDWVATTPILYVEPRKTRWLAASVLASSTGGRPWSWWDTSRKLRTISTFAFYAPIYLHSVRNPRYQKLFDGKGKQNASRLGHFFTVGWAVYPIAFTCPTLRNIYCTPSRISSTRRFIRSPYKIIWA
jgi:hypothetical protein